ncbi:hypothetical protein [Mesorhizobium sp. M0767]|uniref:hypothetical protein n=1 Tax=Mesorhizobium sp. M0767 TaxID=2956995 RepID=UPI00333D69DD
MLTVSVILGDWPPRSEAPHTDRLSVGVEAAAFFPLMELAALVVAVWVGSAWLTAPHTSRPDEQGLKRSWLASAATAWLGLHFLAAAAIIVCSPDWTTASVAAAGLVLTILSVLAWKRMTMSFTDFLWKYGRFTDAKGLRAHIRDPAGHA